MSRKILLFLIFSITSILVSPSVGDGELSPNFFEIDVRKVEGDLPIRFGVKVWDSNSTAYKDLHDILGPVFNSAQWPTLWEVSQSAPAPHNATDERMDLWVESIYRNLQDKESSIIEMGEVLRNSSVDVMAIALGPPEAYFLSHEQKKYRAEKKAQENDEELEDVYYYNGLDPDRIHDFSKFYASSVDRIHSIGTEIPYLQLIENPAYADQFHMYVSPEEYAQLIKQTRLELDARGFTSDKVKLVGIGAEKPGQLKQYLKHLATDREAYDALYAFAVYIQDSGDLNKIQKMAESLRTYIKDHIPEAWPRKPLIVAEFSYRGPDDVEYHGMRFEGSLLQCYDKKYSRKNHMILKDTLPLSPWFAVRLLAGLTIQLSHGLTWINYAQGYDQWWDMACDGLLDRDRRPKQPLAAFESFLKHLTNETYPIEKQWENRDDCYISVFRSDQKRTKIIVNVANFSPKVCERSFGIRGIDLWDVGKVKVTTYNNGTLSINAKKSYQALITNKPLPFDVYDTEDDGESEIEFDLTVGPYAAATGVIDSKLSKKKRAKKESKLEVEIERDEL